MRLKIDTSNVEFRVAGKVYPRQVSKNDPTQKMTGPNDPNGNRPVWSVRLQAFDASAQSMEQIFVDVAGEMPQLTVNAIVRVTGLTYAPWASIDKSTGQAKAKIMRAFRADSVAPADAPARRAA